MFKVILVVLLMTSCIARPYIPGARRITLSSPRVTQLWSKAEGCTKRQADVLRIKWYFVPKPFFDYFEDDTTKINALALWVYPHSIYLSTTAFTGSNEWVIVHEMMHDLLQSGYGNRRHAAIFYKCGVY